MLFMADRVSILFLNTLDLLGTAEGDKLDAVGTVGGKKLADRSKSGITILTAAFLELWRM
jgi:hypothetical protein